MLLKETNTSIRPQCFEFKDPDPNTNILGINELLYDWKHGHAPMATSSATATIVVTDAGGVSHGDTFTLTDPRKRKTTYTVNGGVASGAGGGSGGTAVVGYSGVGGGVAGKVKAATAIAAAINATTDALYAAVSDGVDTVTITQGQPGVLGNTTSTDSISGATVSNFTGGTGGRESDNCLWWRDRAERDQILAIADAPNQDRETLRTRMNTIVSGSTYAIRKLSRPYRFEVERSDIISVGSNRNANKNKDLYKVVHSGKNITLNKTNIYEFKKCDDVIDPQEEDLYTAKVDVEGTTGYLDGDADLLLPFSLYSSSVGNHFSEFKDNLTITNNHDDHMPSLQGPFVREHIGGMPHRRVRVLTAEVDRPEAYIISATATELTVKQPTGLKSVWSRGRENFLNISNIKTNTNRDSHLITGTKLLAKMVPPNGRRSLRREERFQCIHFRY